jgi:hypothetical protein
MKYLNAITDPVYVKPARFSRLDRFFLRFIRDERDLPFAYLTLRISLTMLPLGIMLYLPFVQGWLWWSIAIVYTFLNNFTYKGPFGLMLHCTSHRKFFKKEYEWMNNYLPWVVAPFFGHSPETYYAHHIGMHHAENNLEEDESSTMPYRRDSLRDFMRYFLAFLFTGIYHLASYFVRKKRKRLLVRAVRGELLFIAFCIALCFANWQATVCVFILPFFIYRLIAMMGNWAQHAFICPRDPGNEYRNSITCINTKYNHKCWNDGYHISHHEKQTMHWTEHPEHFRKHLVDYIKNDAIVFDGIHFLHVYFWLMRKRYDLLAKHYVDLNGSFITDAQICGFLRSRTQKIVRDPEAEKDEANRPFVFPSLYEY